MAGSDGARHRGRGTGTVPGRARGYALLVFRQWRRDPWVSLLLALVVCAVAALSTAWPRMALDMNTRQVPHVIDDLSALRRDVTATGTIYAAPPLRLPGGAAAKGASPGGPSRGPVSSTGEPPSDEAQSDEAPAGPESADSTWGSVLAAMQGLRAAQPEPLRSVLGDPAVQVDIDREIVGPGPPGAATAIALTLRVDPSLEDHVEVVEGDWPEVVVNQARPEGATILSTEADPEAEGFEAIEVLLLDEAARTMNWSVGDRWGPLELSGTYRPTDPEDPRWEHADNSTSVGRLESEGAVTSVVTGYLPSASTGVVDTTTSGLRVRMAFPVQVQELSGADVEEATRQLEQFALARHTLLPATPQDQMTQPMLQELTGTFDAESIAQFRQLVGQQQATASLLAVVAAGPVGVALAVLVLGTRLIRVRRSPTVGLLLARGASRRQVGGLLALEGLVLGLPAAALGYAVAARLFPTSSGPTEVVVAAAVGVLPAAAMVLVGGTNQLREERADLGTPGRHRWRFLGEVGLLTLTGLAVWRLLTRGLPEAGAGAQAGPGAQAALGTQTGPDAEAGSSAQGAAVVQDLGVESVTQSASGVDLLLAATPLLLALSACVVALRCYPVPVRVLSTVLRRSRGMAGFLGTARALRDPAAGLLPALAVILGVAIGVSSVVLSSTITRGADVASWESAGAELRVSGPTIGADQRAALRELDGVAEVATAREIPQATALSDGLRGDAVRVVVVDDEMRQVSAAAGPLEPLPEELFEVRSPTPILVLGALAEQEGTGLLARFGQVEVVGDRATLPGVRTTSHTVVLSASNWEELRGPVSSGNAALLSLTGTVPAAQVEEAVSRVIPHGLVQTPEVEMADFRAAPVGAGLIDVFSSAVAVTTALTVLALLLTHHLGAPARARMLSVLRTLGMAPRQGRAMTAWEFGPLLATALLVGVGVGALLPPVLLRALDLTGLTGGAGQPQLHVDVWLLAGVIGAVVVTSVAAVTLSAMAASRSDQAQHLRIGDERT